MRVKIVSKFRDKYTGEIYNRGDVITITEERFNEIESVGRFLYKIPDAPAQNAQSDARENIPESTDKPAESPAAPSGDGFDVMTVRELKEYADKAYKLTFGAGTKKAEIIETLRRMERGSK